MNRVTLGVLATFVVILIGSGILAYVFRDPSATTVSGPPAPAASPAPQDIPLLGELFGSDATGFTPGTLARWEATAARIGLRFSLAAFLAALLAFRPRRGLSPYRRNPYVAQTQILMAVVAGGMMMVVGDSAARAFGIFAAASLVRFRTNIRDPKETTVLAGVSRRGSGGGRRTLGHGRDSDVVCVVSFGGARVRRTVSGFPIDEGYC